jgi:hypothetical protein
MITSQTYWWFFLYLSKQGRYAIYRINAIDDSDDVAAFDEYRLYFYHATQ